MSAAMTYPGHIKAILVLGLPLVGGHLAQFAIGLVDTVMLGWYGVNELAAVTLASTYFFVLFILGGGFALAVMPMVAAAEASGDEISVRRSTRMGLWLSLAYALLVMPLMIWSRPILQLLGQEPLVAQLAAEYLRVACWGIIPALLVMVLKSYLAALERTQVVLWVTLTAAVTNGVVDYMLIFGNWGAPELGLFGAALASLVTQMISLIAIVAYAAWRLPDHQIFLRLWRPDWEMMGRVFRLGVPIGLTLVSEVGLFAASALMMGWLGTLSLAAHGIVVTVASATFMVHLGLCNVATIRAGNAYGRQDRAHMARGAIAVTGLSLVFAVLTMIVFVLAPVPLLSAFMEADNPYRPEILEIGVMLLAVAALFQLVDGAQAMALGLLRGVQDTKVPMVMAAMSYWLIGIPTSYYLGFVQDMGGVGIWLGLVVGLAFTALFLMVRFWGRTIKQIGVAA
ncbi:MATE family efflux transporter [Sedimentitalea todarodis]|uniref:Multidrug-efflux transporter n=1 Tax=Sedimentitalea todarodis TaxID=1631240 RepID=A0ABU3VCF3_9RHOB|nr:MATE family efflux transporter [Sedimentitalea todarodis]MDU9003862.1 MATE family efflux transporter [Sedimentitalea todarodis]